MGNLENESRRGTRKNQIQKIILGTIATAGILSVAAVAPNALQVLGMFMRIGRRKNKSFYTIETSRKGLVRDGFLEYADGGFLRLTRQGEARLRELELGDYKLKKPKHWDKKWRMLSFDIRETRRGLRDKIRRTLVAIGFEKLHYSLWVYPYDCEDLITMLKADFKIGKDLLYIISDKIENDGWLRKHFELK